MISVILANWKYVVIAALLALCGLQEIRVHDAQAETAKVERQFAEARAAAAEAAKKAEQEAREEEERREQRKQEILDAANQETEVARAAAERAGDALSELQRKYSTLASAVRRAATDTAPAKPSETTGDPIGVLAVVLGRLGERAKVVERFADSAHIAGAACEAQYDGLSTSK